MSNSLHDVIAAQKNGQPMGLFSVCSANPVVIETSIKYAAEKSIPILIESTCNQVNQFGGYTGMSPNQFADYVWKLANLHQLPRENLILGGDHLGPYPWQGAPAEIAMQKASQLVHDYVKSGYTKIHLDTSMKCADDDPKASLGTEVATERAAKLCAIAEETAQRVGTTDQLTYVIGTEVPSPGGVEIEEHKLQISHIQEVQETIDATKFAFKSLGLEDAWERVIAVVVQPGVEFGEKLIIDYKPELAEQLSRYIKADQKLVFEAHSTDYQSLDALKKLVEDQFAVLKVGPELTFTYREAMFALELIEMETYGLHLNSKRSNLRKVIENAMKEKPEYWEKYYQGTKEEIAFARIFSYSDRIRYYWSDSSVQDATKLLLKNLNVKEIPNPLLSQYLPEQCPKILQGKLANKPDAIIEDKIQQILQKYASACQLV